MAQKQNSETPDLLLTAKFQCPLTYVDRLLVKDQHGQHQSSSTNDFHMVMLDCLTNYIVEMVGIEATNGQLQITQQDTTDHPAASNDGEPCRRPQDAAFSLFDQMPESRKRG
ncbi:huntingtin-interacting protein M-like [Phyllostomus hastatus]|uniref:huntingtin-interacting protein M-like n=1 Tax=Phyllostomus hastatus TaxID=9423 RepID=UPI001E681D41|nr:huntingtin-interacting protein M-like [Phyllostomus hastatus]